MKQILLFLILITTSQQSFSQSRYDTINFRSPVNIPIILAGNFAELRGNHFHTGIDIKTQGVEGKSILSVEKGYISRVRIAHWGYGKAIYVTHPNGYTTVYAHLKSFNSEIENYVRAHQYENQTETFDVNLEPNIISVERGEQIALSGNTGSSTAPHLHFEIRETKSENAINPLLFKFKITDNIKPILNGVKIYALKDGFVKGVQNDIKIPTKGTNGVYTLKHDNIEVDGEIGFSIHAIDKLNGAHNKCGVFNIKLFVDDSLIFEQSLRRIAFNQNRYINAYKDYLEYHKNRFHYHRSFLLPNNPLPVYDSVKNDGKVTFTDGKLHHLKYEVYDIYGNLSVVKFNVKHNPNMEKSRATIVKHKDYTTLKHNTNDTLAYEGMSIVFEDSSFYEDLTIPISSEKSSKYLSNLYSIDEKYTPVHKYFSIMIDAENVPEEFRSKALIVKINHNGNTKSLGGNFTNKVIKAKTRELGKFAVTLDTIAPTVLGKNIFNGKTFSKNQNIVFNISDDLSGIKTYHVYLNDEWVLSNYNPKRSTLTIKNDELKPFNPEEYTLKIIVFDERKNLTQKSFNITLQ